MNTNPLIRRDRAAVAASAVAFVFYLLTLNPSYGFIDKGELAAVAATAGIAHPTGYPLMTMVGWLVVKITGLIGLRPVLALNLFAALSTAAGVGVTTLLFDYLIAASPARAHSRDARRSRNARRSRRTTKQSDAPAVASGIPEPIRAILAACAALVTGMTTIWWTQANGLEVYSVHTLLLPLVCLLFLRYVDRVAAEAEAAVAFSRDGTLFAFTLGLAFSNHMSTIFLAPAFLYYYFARLGIREPRTWRRLAFLAPGFLAGLLPYIYLPLRASADPRFNWGDPTTLKRFIDHVFAKQYSIWQPWESGVDVFTSRLGYILSNYPVMVAWVGILAGILGIIWLARRNRHLAIWVGLMLLTCLLYASGYDIVDIEPYYLAAVLAYGGFIACGFVWFMQRTEVRIGVGAAAILAVVVIGINYGRSDESDNHLVADMTHNMLENLPPNAVIFSSQWDFWVSGSFYAQAVEGLRPDVTVVDPELLRRSWYLDQLTTADPAFMATVAPQVDRFRAEVYKFEHGLPYDGAQIDAAYFGMMNAMIDRNIAQRPMFVTGDVNQRIGGAYHRIPNDLALRLTTDSSAYVAQPFPNYHFRFWDDEVDSYAARVYELYARSMIGRSLYESQFGHQELARKYYRAALDFDPGYTTDEVPDMPGNREEEVIRLVEFFNQIRAQVARMGQQK